MREISDSAADAGSHLAHPCLTMTTASQLSFCGTEPVGEAMLARAFVSFSQAAASLERSYSQLQSEVQRLRGELEVTNRDLACSLEENRRIRQRVNRILEGLPCGVVVVEAEGSTSTCNPEATDLLGISQGELLTAPLRNLLDHAQSAGGEFKYSPPGKEAKWMAVRHAQLGAEDGRSSIFIFQDISRLKQLQQEHEILRRREALAEMSTALAHEVRNPLGSLELFAGLLAESSLEPQQQRWIEHIQAGLRTLAATVNNVLHFHTHPEPATVSADLGEILRSVCSFLNPVAQQARVAITYDGALDGLRVLADRHRLEQVVLNLALNSFRLMTQGGKLGIAGWQKNGKAYIEIADSGPGIARENLERIFQPGFSTHRGSPGLGLAVCRTIMEQHGGTISAASPPAGGAVFTMEFPFAGDIE